MIDKIKANNLEVRHTQSHQIKAVTRLSENGMNLIELAREESFSVWAEGRDEGYHDYGNQWWSNLNCPFSFKYLAVDPLYSSKYFTVATGHPDPTVGSELYEYMQRVYFGVFGRQFASVLELGTGAGEITRHFDAAGLDYLAVEGTLAGVQTLKQNGIDSNRILHANLKFMPYLNRTFDVVMCTEVAEHIEPFFASKIVENCIRHAEIVWFSAADRKRRPHYHHVNEQDIEAWDNLFAHMGFPFYLPLNGLHQRASRLYLSEGTGNTLFQSNNKVPSAESSRKVSNS